MPIKPICGSFPHILLPPNWKTRNCQECLCTNMLQHDNVNKAWSMFEIWMDAQQSGSITLVQKNLLSCWSNKKSAAYQMPRARQSLILVLITDTFSHILLNVPCLLFTVASRKGLHDKGSLGERMKWKSWWLSHWENWRSDFYFEK